MARIIWPIEEAAGTDETIAISRGWVLIGVSFVVSPLRTDPSGDGGTYSMRYASGGGTDAIRTEPFPVDLNHLFMQVGLQSSSLSQSSIRLLDAAALMDARVIVRPSNTLQLEVAASIVATGTTPLPQFGIYYLIEIEAFFDGAVGYVNVWLDGNLEIAYGPTTVAGGPIKYLQIFDETGSDDRWADDLFANSLTLRYDGGTIPADTPVIGNTVTATPSGVTAVIRGFSGDGVSGILTISNPSGTFPDGDSLADGGLFSTLVNAPNSDFVGGLEPNSGRLKNQFGKAITVVGVGTFNQLRSINAVDGSQATGTLTGSGAISDGETVTITGYGTQTYTFTNPFVDAADNIDASGTTAQAVENLRRAINLDGVAGTNYGIGTALNADITATDNGASVLTATSVFYGTSQNSIGTTETGANLAWGGATLSGGTGENYEAVADIPTLTTKYNQATAVDEQDTYLHNAEPVLATNAIVSGVLSMVYARSSLTGIDGVELLLRDTGATVYSSGRLPLSSSYGAETYNWETRPDTDAGWSRSALVSILTELGLKFVS